MKKLLSVFLAIFIILTAMPFSKLNFNTQAATIRTQQEAVNWILNAEGKYWDWDGAYGAQCVDLIYYYYNYLGVTPRGGNANSYIYDDSKVPYELGWEKIQCYNGFRAQPGDIALFDYGSNGHIGLIIDGDVYGFTTLENNVSQTGTDVATRQRRGYDELNFWGVIRPFPNTVPLSTPTISFNKSSYTVGDTITVSWTASPSDSNLSHYWITVTDPSGKEIIGEGVDKSKTSFSFTASSVGSYTVKVFATPSGSQSGEGSLTDTKSVTVKSNVTTCKIIYDANGGSLGTVPASQTYTYATTGTTRLTYEKPIRDGYTFLGWSLSKTAVSPSYSAGHLWLLSNEGNYTLYAVWGRGTYQASIRPAGGEINGSTEDINVNYTYGSVFSLPEPTRKGYDFVCWTLDYSGNKHILEPWGTPVHSDPSFSNTLSNISVYNLKGNGAVTIEKVSKSSDCPTSSANMLKISTTGAANPDLGGFYQLTNSKASGVFYHMIIAKIPVGYTINRASNSCGDGAETVWLTSQKGTGEFEAYIYKTTCGSTGTFSSFGHVYISGEFASESNPLIWYVGYSEIFDGTGISDSGNYTMGTGIAILRAIWKKHSVHSCDANCEKCKADGTTIHLYSNPCDTSCNICGETRTISHTYSFACDADCNICGFTRTVEHTYDNDSDVECNVCGYLRTTPGDINGDEAINLKDLVTIAQYVAGWENTTVNEAALDVNCDGKVDLDDVTYLSRHLAGWQGYDLPPNPSDTDGWTGDYIIK